MILKVRIKPAFIYVSILIEILDNKIKRRKIMLDIKILYMNKE